MLKGMLVTLNKIRGLKGLTNNSCLSLWLVLGSLIWNLKALGSNKEPLSQAPNYSLDYPSFSKSKINSNNLHGAHSEYCGAFYTQSKGYEQGYAKSNEANLITDHGQKIAGANSYEHDYGYGKEQSAAMGINQVRGLGKTMGISQVRGLGKAMGHGDGLSNGNGQERGKRQSGGLGNGNGLSNGQERGQRQSGGLSGGAGIGKALRVGLCVAMLGCGSMLMSTGCSSSDNLPEHEVLVKDPVDFNVEGIEGELLTNVEAHLNSMPVISKKRSFFYVREIELVASKALRAFGYYHPKIKVNLPDKDKEQDLTVVVVIDEGKPLFIRNCTIEILGEGLEYQVFKDILDQSKLQPYQKLNHGDYEQLKKDIHQTALSLGFFDGKFTSSRILVYQDQNAADIELLYDSGKRYKFGPLVMDEETEKFFRPAKNLQKFHQGDNFSNKDINNFTSYLNQTGYYNSVDVRPVLDRAQNYEVPLELRLDRRPNNNVRLGVGFSTDEGPRVLMEWNKPLLNDRGDSLSFLTTLTMVTQDAQLSYKIPRNNPNLDYYTINASQMHTDLNDTLSDRSQLALHYVANETGVWRRDYSLRLEYEDYAQGSEEGYALNLIPALQISRRESSGGFDPTRGYSLSFEILGGSQAITDHSFVQINASYKGVIAPTDNSRFLFKVSQGATFGPDADKVPPSLRYFAGGDNSIRGFGYRDRAPYQPNGKGLKGAKYMTTGTAEFQFPFGVSNSRLALFIDAGLATDEYDRKKELLYGPGIGYRFLSPYGIVRVDIAAGIQKDSENQYHLHFAFGPEF